MARSGCEEQLTVVEKLEHELEFAKKQLTERQAERALRYTKLKTARFLKLLSRNMEPNKWYLFAAGERVDELPLNRFSIHRVYVRHKVTSAEVVEHPVIFESRDYKVDKKDPQHGTVLHHHQGDLIKLTDVDMNFWVEMIDHRGMYNGRMEPRDYGQLRQLPSKHMSGYIDVAAMLVREL